MSKTRKAIFLVFLLVALVAAGCARTQETAPPWKTRESSAGYRLLLEQKQDALDARDLHIRKLEADLENSRLGAAQRGLPADEMEPAEIVLSPEPPSPRFLPAGLALFDPGQATLKPEAKNAIEEAARMIQAQFPGRAIEIRGHTDNTPVCYSGYRSNWELGAARALAVSNYLIEHCGIAPEYLSSRTLGEFDPWESNATEEGKEKNRRAEIIVILENEEAVEISSPGEETDRADP